MTPLDHDNATATVSITGLALGCYNQATENYEVAFLRHKCHALTIEVKKKMPYGDDSVMMYEIKDYQHRIFIDAENAVSPEDPIYKLSDDALDRTQSDTDPEDFRWVIDFENDLNNGDPVELKPPDVPVTEMYVSKPRLYADQLLQTEEPYLRVVIDSDGRPLAGKDEEFGFFTEGIKADITCQDGGAVILRVDGPQGFEVRLPHDDGPHEITIKNICPPKAEAEDMEASDDSDTDAEGDDDSDDDTDGTDDDFQPTDFQLYYSVIVDTDGKKYDLQSPVHGEGAVCNGGNLGGRAALFPLPASNT